MIVFFSINRKIYERIVTLNNFHKRSKWKKTKLILKMIVFFSINRKSFSKIYERIVRLNNFRKYKRLNFENDRIFQLIENLKFTKES